MCTSRSVDGGRLSDADVGGLCIEDAEEGEAAVVGRLYVIVARWPAFDAVQNEVCEVGPLAPQRISGPSEYAAER